MSRKPLSKRIRFEVFKRDDFQCRYCGASPPDALLHVDHIVPVVEGGRDDIENLATSCDRCNLGKGPRPLTDTSKPRATPDSIEITKERKAQIASYRKHIREWADAKLAAEDEEVEIVAAAYSGKPNVTWKREEAPETRAQVLFFVRRIGLKRVCEAATTSLDRGSYVRDQYRYFCGCCWTIVRSEEEDA
jgi:hypothetical protein